MSEIPAARGQLSEPALTELDWSLGEPGDVYRVILRDETDDRVVSKDPIEGPPFVLDWAVHDPRHRYRWRVQRKVDGTWQDHDDPRYREIVPPRAAVLGARRDRPADPLDADRPGQSLLLFTIDTEAGMSQMRHPAVERAVPEHVFGDFGDGRRLGIDLHMDLLEHVGFRGCFFLDVLFEHHFGRDALERTIEAIQSRGHEIQLHLHTHHLARASDPALRELAGSLYGNDPEPFRRALAHAVALFTERVGHEPVAFRAGGYNICDEFLAVLPELGITIDSSLNPFKNCRTSAWMRTRTQPFRVGDVLEIPVSWMLMERDGAWQPRQLSPYRSITQEPFAARPTDGSLPITSVYVSHSYQLLESHRERHPERGDVVFFGPEVDDARTDLLARTLAAYASRPNARAVTFAELHEHALEAWDGPADRPVDPLPVLLASGQPSTLHTRRTPPPRPPAAGVERPPVETLLREAAAEWHGADVVVWCSDPAPVGRALEELGARVSTLVPDVDLEAAGGALELLRARADSGRLADGIVVDLLDRVPPDRLIDVLAQLHDALRPGGRLALRVTTDMIGEPPSGGFRFCAATYMTALRRAGFAYERCERIPIDERDAERPEVAERLRFLDPLELRTAALDAVVRRPDRAPLPDLELVAAT